MNKEIPAEWMKRFQGLCSKYNVAEDTIDFKAHIDSKLTYRENRTHILKLIKTLSPNVIEITADTLTKAEVEDKEANLEAEYLFHVNEEVNKELDKLKEAKPSVDRYFDTIKNYVSMVCQGDTNALILTGSGGIGKSYTTHKTIVQELRHEDWVNISGYTTPLEFFHILYAHNHKVIVLDDCEGILNNETTISLLKNALWSVSGKRVISYNTTSEKLRCPSQFIFGGRLILILNRIDNEAKRSIQALLSRAIHLDIEFGYSDTMKILTSIARNVPYKDLTGEERHEVIKYLKELTDASTKELNIRSLMKSYDVYIYSKKAKGDWKELIRPLFEQDEDQAILLSMMKSRKRVGEQIKDFEEKTGYSRRTFFRMKKKLIGRL